MPQVSCEGPGVEIQWSLLVPSNSAHFMRLWKMWLSVAHNVILLITVKKITVLLNSSTELRRGTPFSLHCLLSSLLWAYCMWPFWGGKRSKEQERSKEPLFSHSGWNLYVLHELLNGNQSPHKLFYCLNTFDFCLSDVLNNEFHNSIKWCGNV